MRDRISIRVKLLEMLLLTATQQTAMGIPQRDVIGNGYYCLRDKGGQTQQR
jgi:hypothetical protein